MTIDPNAEESWRSLTIALTDDEIRAMRDALSSLEALQMSCPKVLSTRLRTDERTPAGTLTPAPVRGVLNMAIYRGVDEDRRGAVLDRLFGGLTINGLPFLDWESGVAVTSASGPRRATVAICGSVVGVRVGAGGATMGNLATPTDGGFTDLPVANVNTARRRWRAKGTVAYVAGKFMQSGERGDTVGMWLNPFAIVVPTKRRRPSKKGTRR